ncbi:MAG: LysR family transcriptional regulator [Alphaproteobacteria bacterium]|nr:LysR family transcriptional regulator [Alphaproteobacteria bacterium]
MLLSKRINWNLLYTFVILAETGSLSRTAQILGRGQPAISAALKKLELQVGHALAERGPRYFRLTEAGRMLQREASAICGTIDRISGLLKDVEGTVTGEVAIAIASHMTSPIIDLAFASFRRKHPRTTMNVAVTHSGEMLRALTNRVIPFAIGPVHSKSPGLSYEHIFREFCGFYCGRGHELFGRTDLTVADLENQSAITYRSAMETDTLQSISDLARAMRFAQPFAGISNNLEEVRRLVVAGVGIGAIPVQIAARDVRDALLWRLPPHEDVMPIDIYLIVNTKVRLNSAEAAFLEMLRTTIRETPEDQRVYREID